MSAIDDAIRAHSAVQMKIRGGSTTRTRSTLTEVERGLYELADIVAGLAQDVKKLREASGDTAE